MRCDFDINAYYFLRKYNFFLHTFQQLFESVEISECECGADLFRFTSMKYGMTKCKSVKYFFNFY